jgi:hypothetical protein
MHLSIRALILFVTLMLGACGTLAEGQTQDITLRTPGATEAKCMLDNGLRYSINTGETIQIMRSFHAMEVECYAIGNRYKKLTIPAGPNPWSAANVTNGVVPGTAYDAASMGLYTYPEIITVDFRGDLTTGFELPDYHNRDAQNPYDQSVEDMGPDTLKGPAGVDYLPRGVEKRDMGSSGNPFMGSGLVNPSEASASETPAAAKPVPTGSNAEELNRSANPTVFNK